LAQRVVEETQLTALELAREMGHEELVVVHEASSSLRAVIAIHDTTFGHAVGGTRMRPYTSLDAAARDALRLARAMTYKAVMAEVPRGGGKAVILGDPARDKTDQLLKAYGRAVDRLGGRFQTGCDMGIGPKDVATMCLVTPHASHTAPGGKLETAGLAALGVFESMKAVVRALGREMAELHVALQGLGQVGFRLARLLATAGARLTVADLDGECVARARDELGATSVGADAIFDVRADVFSPNAAGGILNDETIPRLACRAVVGAANEQLLAHRHGDDLHGRGILYGPDYLVNAGGLLSLLYEKGEISEEEVVARVQGIGERLFDLIEGSRKAGIPPYRLADKIVEERLFRARLAHP
jgi:leucine dehydrogenase